MLLQTIVISAITTALLSPAITAAFTRLFGDWLVEKIRQKYAKELEAFKSTLQQQQQVIDALTTRALYVSRAQFDTEFTAMKEVSQQLAKVMLAFRKIHSLDVGEELEEAELIDAARILTQETKLYLEKLTEWAVFLEPPIFDEFNRCYEGANEEGKRLQGHNLFHTDQQLNVRHFTTSYSNASQKVRDRIKLLSALPGLGSESSSAAKAFVPIQRGSDPE
ncbi:MAG TPA: hypothetical protein VJ848_11030 [Candidatus Angelobacter sp.]|nr:hypothetical protein [Candidatus Angelobacter sp.]